MFTKIIKFIFIAFIIFSIHFLVFGRYLKQYFPEGNIVLIEKKEKILDGKKILFEDNKPNKITSKGIFIEKNKILTVKHGVGDENDKYLIFTQESILPKKAKLIFKDEKKDLAILEFEENFLSFFTVAFGKVNSKDEIYFYKNGDYKKAKVSEIKESQIFLKEEFLPGDSGTIFFNKQKEIIGILTEYDLNEKIAIVDILEKNYFKEKTQD